MKTHERSLPLDDIDGAKAAFVKLRINDFTELLPAQYSEADTRAKLIDVLLRQVLGWPETAIKREPHVTENDGYIDYVLSTARPYFIVEAKKNWHRYKLPALRSRQQYKAGGVLHEDKYLVADMAQARDYAINCGVAFCCLTNGEQFLFFRSQNDSGVPWREHVVILFRDHQEIEDKFTLFFHLFSFAAVSQGVVHGYLPITENYHEALRRYKKLDPTLQSIARTRERNKLFPALRAVISRVFQDIAGDVASAEILENCYVETPRDSSYEKGMGGLLRKKNIAMGHHAKPLVVTKKDAGAFQKTVHAKLGVESGEAEVLLMLGGVGVGKTTFIHRFRKVIAPDDIDDNCLWMYIDFNKYSDTGEPFIQWVVRQAWEALHQDYPALDIDTYAALKQAYHAEYEQLKRGRLDPIFKKDPEEFERVFAIEIEKYMQEEDRHFIKMMRLAITRNKRRPFLVFDNADQFSSDTQDKVFRLAQKFAKDIGCSAAISLREESYWKNKDHGTLSAFHATSYQVQPPRLAQVISKRLRFADKLLSEITIDFVDSDGELVTVEDLRGVLDRVTQSILASDSRYLEFLECLSPSEIRRPLAFLSRFLVSGHTNMDAMLKSYRRGTNIEIGYHEFLQAIILGDREYYSENASDIINLFAVDGRADASNLNRLVILGRILNSKNSAAALGEGFMPVADLVSDCERYGLLPDTTRSIVAFFNSKLLVETEAQDRESMASATFVRATVAGQYYLEKFIYDFSYIDSVIIDTAIGDDDAFNKLHELTSRIGSMGKNKGAVRLERLAARLDRARKFLTYILQEYEDSTARRFVDELDPSVKRYFETASGKLIKQSHEIERKAQAVFR